MPAFSSIRNVAARLALDEAGLSTMEYGIILAFVALGSIPALSALGESSKQNLDQTGAKVEHYRRTNADPFSYGRGNAGDQTSRPGINGGSGNQNAPDPYEPAPMQVAPSNPYEPAPMQMAPPQ